MAALRTGATRRKSTIYGWSIRVARQQALADRRLFSEQREHFFSARQGASSGGKLTPGCFVAVGKRACQPSYSFIGWL